jgi:CheY-like chemotaxis protein
MRPKKKILLIDADEERLSVRRFTLTTNQFKVFSATSAAEALSAARDFEPEVALIVWPFDGAARFVEKLRAWAPFTKTLLLAEGSQAQPEGIVTDMALWGSPSASELLDRLKTLAACKRGPKKMPPAPAMETAVILNSQHFSEMSARRVA